MNIIQNLTQKGKISPPSWLPGNMIYITIMGSEAYGTATDLSDKDIHGICMPPRYVMFPHEIGYIHGFSSLPASLKPNKMCWLKHGVDYENQEYDFTVNFINKFFYEASKGNPQYVDFLFTPRECILFTTIIGEKIREKRHLFLAKTLWPAYKGYAYSQLRDATNPHKQGKRRALIDEFGYDTKSACHVVRLLSELEQILETKDLDLRKDRANVKYVRDGRMCLDDLKSLFHEKEKRLEKLKDESSLRDKPDKEAIKSLLVECIESYYENLEIQTSEEKSVFLLRELFERLEENKSVFIGG